MSTVSSIVAWFHIVAVVVSIGGAAVNLIVFRPAVMKTLDPPTMGKLMGAVQMRMRYVQWTAIVVLLVTGLYMAVVVRGINTMDDLTSTMFGRTLSVKAVLALVLFTLALIATLPLKATAKLRQNPRLMLRIVHINVGLAAIIVFLASFLMRRGGLF